MKLLPCCEVIEGLLGLCLIAGLLAGCASTPKKGLQAGDHYQFAQSYLAAKSYTFAEQEIRKALALQPDESEYFGLLALVYQAQGLLNPAEEAYQSAVQSSHVAPAVLLNYSTLLLLQGREDEAIVLAQRVLQTPGYSKPARAYANIGVAYLRKEDPQQAMQQLLKALEYQKNMPQVYHNLGLAYNRLGYHDEAIQAFREAIRLQPAYAEAHAGLGMEFLATGETQQAVQQLHRALEYQKNMPRVYHNLGLAYDRLGQRAEARAAFERTITLAPDSQAAVEARAQLKRLAP